MASQAASRLLVKRMALPKKVAQLQFCISGVWLLVEAVM
jgi:hypothetical protein